MKATEAAALLTVAAAFDNRKPDEDQARAWAMALDGLNFEDCRDAIVTHYRGSREWMMPSDVIGKVKRMRSDRIIAFGVLEPPAHIDPDDTSALQQWEHHMRRAIADGRVTRETHPEPAAVDSPAPEALAARVAQLREAVRSNRRDGLTCPHDTPPADCPTCTPAGPSGTGDSTSTEEEK